VIELGFGVVEGGGTIRSTTGSGAAGSLPLPWMTDGHGRWGWLAGEGGEVEAGGHSGMALWKPRRATRRTMMEGSCARDVSCNRATYKHSEWLQLYSSH
jgi:hypothetical protein